MRQLVLTVLVVLLLSGIAVAQVWVNGYTDRNGRYVPGHWRSAPDNTVRNNYTYKGNVNPYTGQQGSNYYRNSPTSEYYRQPSYQQPTYRNPYQYQAPQQNYGANQYRMPQMGLKCPSCSLMVFPTYQKQGNANIYRCGAGHLCTD